MEIINTWTIISSIAAVATAGAAWIEVVQLKKKGEEKICLIKAEVKYELEDFFSTYDIVANNLKNLLINRVEIDTIIDEILESYLKTTPPLLGTFKYWNKHKIEILNLVSRKEKEMQVKELKDFMEKVIRFKNLYYIFLEKMTVNRKQKFNDFCKQFLDEENKNGNVIGQYQLNDEETKCTRAVFEYISKLMNDIDKDKDKIFDFFKDV